MEIDGPSATVQGGTACAEAPARTAGVRDVDFQKCAVGLHAANLPPLPVQYSASLGNDRAFVRPLYDQGSLVGAMRLSDLICAPSYRIGCI